ncbi:type II toxin-antitoxin system PemK/MazF family toxin [Maribellus sediminis]|uniref:type II toxin-antitoxin system PemK/MazF family toxin n=1 Tax=Maribellus sediminis TaxID=2696285 RepID=UPI00197F07F3|nr:type II toxin-antitoxin system PemK/MazF family toxin [Maribellus sediminis]
MQKGDIVLIPFPFTDLSGRKLRPALVLCSSVKDVTVCFITTQFQWEEEFDIEITPSAENGIKKSSLIRVSKLATIDSDLVIGELGRIEDHYISRLNRNLIQIFQLD